MADPLAKALSLPPPRGGGHENDYRLWGNREFLRDESRTTWIKIGLPWNDFQELSQPTSRAASWADLNTAPRDLRWFRELDGEVKAANEDGVRVILTLADPYPPWSSGATAADTDLSYSNSRKTGYQKVPNDLSPNGPWAWFVSHVSARYKRGAAPNPEGPHEPRASEKASGYDPRLGNPSGAWIEAIEICNEPNTILWPQADIHLRVAEMVRTAEALSFQWGGQRILAPATLDSPDPTDSFPAGSRTDWRVFTERLLDALAGFAPRVPVHWSMHNYRDVAREVTRESSRVREVIDLLYAKNWKGGGDRDVYLTEAGVNMGAKSAESAARDEQAEKIYRNFYEMREQADVVLWTQHAINDATGVTFRSALRDDFDFAGGRPGPPRPSWHAWRTLPGA